MEFSGQVSKYIGSHQPCSGESVSRQNLGAEPRLERLDLDVGWKCHGESGCQQGTPIFFEWISGDFWGDSWTA